MNEPWDEYGSGEASPWESYGAAETPTTISRPSYAANLAGALQQSNLYGTATTAFNQAKDKGIRRRQDGDWDLPMLAPLTGGLMDVLQGPGALVRQAAGQRLPDAPTGGVDPKQIQKVFHDFQQANNLSDEEVQAAWSDLGNLERKWGDDEKYRVLSNGQIIPNPTASEWLDNARAADLVRGATDAPEEAKADFLRRLPKVQADLAAEKAKAYEAGTRVSNVAGIAVPGALPVLPPSQWAERNGRTDVGTPEFVRDYESYVEAQPDAARFLSGIAGRYALGWAKVANTALGVAGLAGSDAATAAAATGTEASNVARQGMTPTGTAGSVVEEIPSVLAQVVSGQFLGAAAGAVTTSAKTAQTITSLGVFGTAGLQSAGLTYADEIAQGTPEDEARLKAGKAGLTTMVVTAAFGTGGMGAVERVAAGKAAEGVTVREVLAVGRELGTGSMLRSPELRKLAGGVLASVAGEATEEGIDQLLSAFLTADPDTSLADAWSGAVEAAVVGGAIGGTVGVAETAARELAVGAAPLAPASARAALEPSFPDKESSAGAETRPTEAPAPEVSEAPTPALAPAEEPPTTDETPIQELPTAPEPEPEKTIDAERDNATMPQMPTNGIPDFDEPQTPTIAREDLKTAFNLDDEQAEVAEGIARALGLTPERVLVEREFEAVVAPTIPEPEAPTIPEPEAELAVGAEIGAFRNEAPNGTVIEADLGLGKERLTREDDSWVTEDGMSVTVPPSAVVVSLPLPPADLRQDLLPGVTPTRRRSLSTMRAEVVRKLGDSEITPRREKQLTALLGRIESAMMAERKVEAPAAEAATPAAAAEPIEGRAVTPTPAAETPAPEVAKKTPKKADILATSPTQEGIEKSIAKFYGGEAKTLVPTGAGEFALESPATGKRLSTKVVQTSKGFYFVRGEEAPAPQPETPAAETPAPIEGRAVTQRPDGRWMVQSEENRQRAAAGQRQIGGDRIFDTLEEAQTETRKEIELEKRDAADKQAREAAEAAEAEREAVRLKPLTDFTASMTPMQRGKVEKVLREKANRASKTLGKQWQGEKFEVLAGMVRDGYRPVADGKRYRLELPEGAGFDILRTEYDFALSQVPETEAPPAPAPEPPARPEGLAPASDLMKQVFAAEGGPAAYARQVGNFAGRNMTAEEREQAQVEAAARELGILPPSPEGLAPAAPQPAKETPESFTRPDERVKVGTTNPKAAKQELIAAVEAEIAKLPAVPEAVNDTQQGIAEQQALSDAGQPLFADITVQGTRYRIRRTTKELTGFLRRAKALKVGSKDAAPRATGFPRADITALTPVAEITTDAAITTGLQDDEYRKKLVKRLGETRVLDLENDLLSRLGVAREDLTGERFQTEGRLTDAQYARHAELEAKHNAGTITDAERQEAQELVDAAARGAGYDVKVAHGTDEARDIFDGGAYFTDSRSDASAYAELRAMKKAVEENDELSEIVYDVLAEEGGEELTDLGPDTIREIADANGIDLNDADGVVLLGYLRGTNPIDISELGTDVGDLKTTWDFLHSKGLLEEKWSDLDEDAQYELKDQYDGLALYRLLEGEGVLARAFEKGYDVVQFDDISPDGGSAHTSWLTKDASQFKSSDPFTGVPLSERFNPGSPDIRYQMDDRDAEYLAAVERGDMETAQRMVDEAAQKLLMGRFYNGLVGEDPGPVYRRGVNNIRDGRVGGEFGFWFTDDRPTAEDYAKGLFGRNEKGFVRNVFLRMRKPLDLRVGRMKGDYNVTPAEFIEAMRDRGVNVKFDATKLAEDEAINRTARTRDFPAIQPWWRYFKTDSTLERAGMDVGQIREAIQAAGFDSVILPDKSGNHTARDAGAAAASFIVFSPDQIKSADPVTYDADGNVIPLSQRFDSASPDIRYQSRPQGAKGSAQLLPNQQVLLKGFASADFTTAAHEMMHGFEMTGYGDLTDAEVATLKNWAGSKTAGRSMMEVPASEKLARGWERYLAEGKAPLARLQALFDKIAGWMLRTYKSLDNPNLAVDISPEVRAIFDKLASRLENPSFITTPSGTSMETADGSPLPPAIEPTPENIAAAETLDDVAGLIRGTLEAQAAIPSEPEIPDSPDWNPEGLYSMQERRALEEAETYGLDTEDWKQARRTFGQLWQSVVNAEAAHQKARPEAPSLGSDFLARIASERNPDRVFTDREVSLLTHEGLRRKGAVQRTLDDLKVAEASDDKEAIRTAYAAHDDAMASYQALHDIAAGARTASGRSLNAWKYALRDDYSYATLFTRHLTKLNASRRLSNKEPVTSIPKEEIDALRKYAAEQEARIAEMKAEMDRMEGFTAEQQALIEELIAERKAKKKPAVSNLTKKLIADRVKKAAAEARARLAAANQIDVRYQSEADPLHQDRILVMADDLLADPQMSDARFAELVRLRFKQSVDAAALRRDTEQHLRDAMDDITGEHVPTAEEIMADYPEDAEVDREMVMALARAHIYEGARNFEVLDRVHATIHEQFPATTREQVAQLFTRYGEFEKLPPDELEKALRTAKSLELVQKQIDDLTASGRMKRTGRGKDDPSVELRELRKKRDDLAKDLGYVPRDPETQLSSAQAAAKKRLQNEIEEIRKALESGTPRVRVRRGVEYTEDLVALRQELDALRATYQDTFGRERTPAEIEARILKDLDRRIAREQDLIERGLMAEPESARPAAVESAEITARRQKLADLRQQKRDAYERANPGALALAQAMDAAEKALAKRQAIVAAGVPAAGPRKARDAGITPTAELTSLWEAADALDDVIREIRRERPRTPEQELARLDAAYDRAVQTREVLRRRIAEGDIATAPRAARSTEARTEAVRRENDALRKTITQMQRDKGVGPFSPEFREARREEILLRRLAEIRQKTETRDFQKKTRTEPATNQRIRELEADIYLAKMKFETDRAKYVYSTLTKNQKLIAKASALYQARMMLNLTGDLGTIDRQLGKLNFVLLGQDLRTVAKRLREGRKPAFSETMIADVAKKAYASFMSEEKQVELYRQMSTDPRYPFHRKNGFDLLSPHDTSHELNADGKVRLNPLEVINDRMIAALMLTKGIGKMAAGVATGGLMWKTLLSGAAMTVAGAAGAVAGRRVALRIERANQTILNVARWHLLETALQMRGDIDASASPDFAKDVTIAVMTMTGKTAGTGGVAKFVKNNAFILGHFLSFPQYRYTNFQSVFLGPLARIGFGTSKQKREAAKVVGALYGHWLAGYATKIVVAAAILGTVAGDDDEETAGFGIVMDVKSPNFGTLKVGKTYIDFASGARQWLADAVSLFGTKTLDKDALAQGYVIEKETSGYDRAQAMDRFLRKNINPNIKLLWEVIGERRTYDGGDLTKLAPIDAANAIGDEVIMNLTVKEFMKIREEHGNVEGAKIFAYLMLGNNVNVSQTAEEKEADRIEKLSRYVR